MCGFCQSMRGVSEVDSSLAYDNVHLAVKVWEMFDKKE